MPLPVGTSLDPRFLGELAAYDTINNDNWDGTDLAISNGGTGASTQAGARTNLGLGSIATQDSSNVSITGGTISGGTIQSGVNIDEALIELPEYTVAGLPSPTSNTRRIVYCSNGDAGSQCLAFSDGSFWKVIAIGANVSAT
jgi:hypothetical protein